VEAIAVKLGFVLLCQQGVSTKPDATFATLLLADALLYFWTDCPAIFPTPA